MVGVLFFALFFWGWAIQNSVEAKGFDLGVLSFLLVSAFCAHIWSVSNSGRRPGPTTRRLLLASQIFVAVNYLGGAVAGPVYFDKGIGYAIYCTVFVLIWCAIAWLRCRILADEEALIPFSSLPADKEKKSEEQQVDKEKKSEEQQLDV